jgi:hypothetical protein
LWKTGRKKVFALPCASTMRGVPEKLLALHSRVSRDRGILFTVSEVAGSHVPHLFLILKSAPPARSNFPVSLSPFEEAAVKAVVPTFADGKTGSYAKLCPGRDRKLSAAPGFPPSPPHPGPLPHLGERGKVKGERGRGDRFRTFSSILNATQDYTQHSS